MYYKMNFLWQIVILCVFLTKNCANSQHFEVIKEWTTLTYIFPKNWPSHDKNLYNPENVVPSGLEIVGDRIFVAMPRIYSGVPATLATADVGNSPVLNAYPNWDHHMAGLRRYSCNDTGLVSVYRMRVDSCNRLWVLDAGVSRSLEDFEVTCPPKILIYDLKTDQVVRRIEFPKAVLRGESLFTNFIIDETTSDPKNNCNDPFIYITDTIEPGIVVYDSKADLTWRVSHPNMFPNPDFSRGDILGNEFVFMDGIVGLAFDQEAAIVYFQPVATDRIFSVKRDALRIGPVPNGKELPVKTVIRKSSQGLGLACAPFGGNIYFNPFTETSIVAYNPHSNEQK